MGWGGQVRAPRLGDFRRQYVVSPKLAREKYYSESVVVGREPWNAVGRENAGSFERLNSVRRGRGVSTTRRYLLEEAYNTNNIYLILCLMFKLTGQT